jgi:2-polyprenyl-3-methyl-5-hydroxy-6-metoxy-1,4-benzoquinol methylase
VPASEPYTEHNLLDRVSRRSTLEVHYRQMMSRERDLLARRLSLGGGEVVSIGCGWHPGRHLFGSPQFRLLAVDADPEKIAGVMATGRADEGHVGYAGKLDDLADASFDVVLYRLVLHHLVFQGPLAPIFSEAWTVASDWNGAVAR